LTNTIRFAIVSNVRRTERRAHGP